MTNDAGDPTFDPRWNGAAIAKDDWHFHRRLLTRYGVVLGPGEYSKIQKKIRKGRYKILNDNRGRPLYRVYTPSDPRGFYVLSFGGRLLTAWPAAAGDRLKAASEQRSSEGVSKMSEMFNASDQQVHVDAEVQESNKALWLVSRMRCSMARSDMMHRRSGTPVRASEIFAIGRKLGPGSAAHHFASLRAALRPGLGSFGTRQREPFALGCAHKNATSGGQQ